MEASASGGETAEVAVLAALTSRGWCLREENEEIRALVRSCATSEPVVSELLNMDMRSFGGKSLPDPTSLRKLNHIQGPKILQIVSVRDIYQSIINASLKTSQHSRRMLRFSLTDGHSEVTAIEYSPIPTISDELIPGSKVCLQNKVPVHSGILCLNSKVLTVVGGLVQSLYEEWQINQKYSGSSRSSLKLSHNDGGTGPPPFEKLKIEDIPKRATQPHRLYDSVYKQRQGTQGNQIDRRELRDTSLTIMENDTEKDNVDDEPTSSQARPKEVSEAVPVQNQAAAQKLLQKMIQPAHKEMHTRAHRHKFKAKQEEAAVFTLDEWERTKGMKPKSTATGYHMQDTSHDEELARQLQNQLDLEDSYANAVPSEAEQIRRSMFSFGNAEERGAGRTEFRGRGRGRGRGRRRFG